MSKISKIVKEDAKIKKLKPVVNYMGGISYKLNPLETLKMISASSIFGEPQYYRDGIKDEPRHKIDKAIKEYLLFEPDAPASEIMINAIKDSLDYDFLETIKWAKELRQNFFMRLNPQIIMVLASMHPKRAEFSKKYPELFREINLAVMKRADEPASQLASYLYLNGGSKNNLPSILKRSWRDRIKLMSAYEISKYKNAELGLIDVVRVCHAKSPLVDKLMNNEPLQLEENEKTWENLRSKGMSWKDILKTIQIPHMALLRNLRGIFNEFEDNDTELAKTTLQQLKNGVLKGMQFPYRYYNAYNIIKKTSINFKPLVLDTLEECIDISINNMPKLKGKTICLSDNSGSAWGAFTSEYGSCRIAEIDNLSSVITGMCSDEGYVGKFGDKLEIIPVSKRNGALNQAESISSDKGIGVGLSTENGIWLFFEEAITNNVFYDNIFIYSDMQAGHGGLYGEGKDYLIGEESFAFNKSYNSYIDVMKLIQKYKQKVNPKANVFCVQTAGYDNVLIPEYIHRGAVLYGWTGKEPIFAKEIIKQWDEIEDSHSKNFKNMLEENFAKGEGIISDILEGCN